MAIIHNTTMSPGKLELLAGWLPAQPWYLDRGREPELTRAGGFRLDDPEGEVGIEFMVVSDRSGGEAVYYQVPMTYRAGALADADGAPGGQLSIRINRVLQPIDDAGQAADGSGPGGDGGRPCLSAPWRLPDGTGVRGVFATARYAPAPA